MKQAQECDEVLTDLIGSIARMLPFIRPVESRARIEPLKDVIKEMLGLIGDSLNFLLEYKGDGLAGKLQSL